jgi:hypothetical protein
MAGVIENYSKFEACTMVRFLHSETHCSLVSVYGQKAFSGKKVVQQIGRWLNSIE